MEGERMLSKKNHQLQAQKLEAKQQHFAIKRLTVGVASVLISSTFAMYAGLHTAMADETARPQATDTASETTATENETAKPKVVLKATTPSEGNTQTATAGSSSALTTTSGGKITESQYYDSMKKTTSGKQVLQQMILDKILEGKYGDKVTDKAVNKEYNKYKKQYGSSFSTVLAQNGMTASAFKKSIRSNLLLRQAVIANTKITNADLKKQWKSYEPTITVAQILVSKKEDADAIIEELKKDGSWDNFKKLAKEKSIDESTKNDGGKLPSFNNMDTSLDSDFKKAAFALKQGEFSQEPVKTSYGYHIIYSIKNPGKGKMADHTKELKDQIIDEKLNDSTALQKIIAKEFKEGNVNIKDSDLKDVLSDYISSTSSSSSK